MPHELQLDETQRVVWSRCWGVLTDDDLASHQELLRGDPRFANDYHQLVDTREVTEVHVSARMILQLGQSRLFAPHSKRAYVVTRDVLFGLVRMYGLYQELRGRAEIRAFRTRAEAVAWLGVDDACPFTAATTEREST